MAAAAARDLANVSDMRSNAISSDFKIADDTKSGRTVAGDAKTVPLFDISKQTTLAPDSATQRPLEKVPSVTTAPPDDAARSSSVDGWSVYVLLCAGGKFYVGKSRDVQRRFLQHIKLGSQAADTDKRAAEAAGDDEIGSGSAWTRMHEPLEIVRSFPMRTPHDEETTTLDLMVEKGIENVRGGPFCAVELPMHQVLTLQQRIASLRDLCYLCGESGHYAADCPTRPPQAQTNPVRLLDDDQDDLQQQEATGRRGGRGSRKRAGARGTGARARGKRRRTAQEHHDVCVRCGRNSHTADVCFAHTDLRGNVL